LKPVKDPLLHTSIIDQTIRVSSYAQWSSDLRFNIHSVFQLLYSSVNTSNRVISNQFFNIKWQFEKSLE